MITEFTPYSALLGGALIGLASVALMLMLGRIMGATGILAGIWHPESLSDLTWRVAILAGMISGPAAMWLLTGAMPEVSITTGTPLLLLGGFLVGVGVTFASGCTSGHGVCGLARLSPRSIAATATFMVTTTATVFVLRHLI